VTGEVRHFKVSGLAYHGMSQPVGDKPTLKGSNFNVTNFKNFAPREISFERPKLYRLQISCTVWPREVLTVRWPIIVP